MKPKLFQVNVCLNFSTGKIAQQIGETAINSGWDSWIAYSGREAKVVSKSKTFRIGSFINSCLHYACQLLFDMEGLCSKKATKTLIKKIDEINPDILLLHVIHDHWLNYKILFSYLAQKDIHVIWVQHDCWSFTGGCMYFDMLGCNRWKYGCASCPDKRALFNRASHNYLTKKYYLSRIKSLTFVSVSDWIAGLLKESVQGERPVFTIHNGCDINNYAIITDKVSRGIGTPMNLLGVAGVWAPRKGLGDFILLRKLLPEEEFSITLIGLTKKQIKSLPKGIHGLGKTQNEQELANYYSNADIYINPTYSDNFPTTNIEALACGTPVITYNTGGSPEAIDEKTGLVVPQGDIKLLIDAIYKIKKHPLSPVNCRKRAEELFDRRKCYEKYIHLFNNLMHI